MSDGRSSGRPPSLVELRVLDGPNLYFPRPTIKLTLDVSPLLGASEGEAMALARPPACVSCCCQQCTLCYRLMSDFATLQTLSAAWQLPAQTQGTDQETATLIIQPDDNRVLGPAGTQLVYTFENG